VRLPARIGLITLACRDVERMAMLFGELGWPETPESDADHRTFQCTNGVVVGLCAASHYEPHFGPPTRDFRGLTLCVNLESFDECRQVHWLDRARRFAMHALEQVEAANARDGRGRHSLWTGDLGPAIYGQSCIEASAAVPTIDAF
jgi:hypothetical protein